MDPSFPNKRLPEDKEGILVFIISTQGQGDCPVAFRKVWSRLLLSSLSRDHLKGLRFAVFGLGDSAYATFNYAARKLFIRLKQIGAQPIISLGVGDEMDEMGYFSGLSIWTERLVERLRSEFNIFKDPDKLEGDIYRSEANTYRSQFSGGENLDGFEQHSLLSKTLLTKEGYNKRVYKLEFMYEDASKLSKRVRFETGDVLAIMPANSENSVDGLLKAVGVDRETIVVLRGDLKRKMGSDSSEIRVSLADLFKFKLEINSVPKKSFFEVLIDKKLHAKTEYFF